MIILDKENVLQQMGFGKPFTPENSVVQVGTQVSKELLYILDTAGIKYRFVSPGGNVLISTVGKGFQPTQTINSDTILSNLKTSHL